MACIVPTFSLRKMRARMIVGKEKAALTIATILTNDVALKPNDTKLKAATSNNPIKKRNFQRDASLIEMFAFVIRA